MRQTLLLVLMMVGLVSIGCKDSTTVTNSGSDVTGDLKGVIALYDSSGQLVNDKSGVLVELIGTNFSAVTDTGGRCTIQNLPSRTYDMKFSKPGYGTLLSQLQFLGGSTLWFGSPDYPVIMRQPPTFTVALDAIISPSAPDIDSFGVVHPKNGFVFFHYSKNSPLNIYFGSIIICSRSATLDLHDPSTYQQIAIPSQSYKYPTIPDSVLSSQMSLGYHEGFLAGFASGETIYFRAYPYVAVPLYYYDMKTYTQIFTSYGEGSNILSITAP